MQFFGILFVIHRCLSPLSKSFSPEFRISSLSLRKTLCQLRVPEVHSRSSLCECVNQGCRRIRAVTITSTCLVTDLSAARGSSSLVEAESAIDDVHSIAAVNSPLLGRRRVKIR